MRAVDIVSLLIGAVMIVFYFTDVLPRLGPALTSPPLVALYWVVVAVFVAPPVAKFVSEKLVGSVFGGKAGKITREYSRAKSLAARGRFEEALEEYRRGLENEPDNVMLRMEIAEIYSGEMKDYHRAISELERCLALKLGATQGASILNRMADIYETNLGDIERALAALQKIEEEWPGTKLAARAQERIRSLGGEAQNSA
jgi:tetratricopeptide (TPR) repeat protein